MVCGIMSMSTHGSESPGSWNQHRSKLGLQNAEYSCQVPYHFLNPLFDFYSLKIYFCIKIIRTGDGVEVGMVGRDVKCNKQHCDYGCGSRHACTHAIIFHPCACHPYLSLSAHTVIRLCSCPLSLICALLDYISEQHRSCSIWSILEYSEVISQHGKKVYK
jgi:hypothetical protein